MDTCRTSTMPMHAYATTQNLSSQHLPTLTDGLTHKHTKHSLTPVHSAYILEAKNFIAYCIPISGQS